MRRSTGRAAGWQLRSVVTLATALLAAILIAAGGSFIGAQSATFDPGRIPLVGRTRSVCTVPDGDEGTASDQRRTEIGAVVMRKAPGREGRLDGGPLTGDEKLFTLDEQGTGELLRKPAASVLLSGEGVMATASAGSVITTAASGDDQGISVAPCTAPAVDHWFVGVGHSDQQQSTLILTNVDETQAEVDLRFFGAKGMIIVPGSPGMIVPGRSSVTVGLASLVDAQGPLTVSVHATKGRVAAISRDQRSVGDEPAGADWHPSAISPRRQVVVPGLPSGAGGRELLVVNPGDRRAVVKVEVLGAGGSYAPIGAETVDVAPESTASVDLADALGGEAAGLRLSSDQPVTATVQSTSSRSGASSDLAFEVADPPVIRSGIAAAAILDGAASTLQLANNGPSEVTVSFDVVSYAGRILRQDDVPMAAGSSDTRVLTQTPPAYLVVRTPEGADVHASVTQEQNEGDVAGLTTPSLVSPDLASRAPQVRQDPAAGR